MGNGGLRVLDGEAMHAWAVGRGHVVLRNRIRETGV